MVLSAASGLTKRPISASKAFQAYATADVFYSGAAVAMDISTGLVEPMAASNNYPDAIFVGICQKTKTTTTSTHYIDVDTSGSILEGIAVTGVTGDSDVGRVVYCTSDDIASNCTITATNTAFPIGKIVKHQSSTTCDILTFSAREAFLHLGAAGSGMLYVATVSSSAVTNTAAQTAFDTSYTLPVDVLQAGDVLEITSGGIATATNSSNTLRIHHQVAGVDVAATPAIDVADGDIWGLRTILVVRSIGASGVISFTAIGSGPDVNSGVGGGLAVASLATDVVDTTSTIVLRSTATWSAASAANSCRQDIFNVELKRRGA